MSVTEECSASAGWIPMPTAGSYQYSQLGFHHFETPSLSAHDEQVYSFWKTNNIDTTGLDSCRKIMIAKMLSTSHAMGRLLNKLDLALKEPTSLGYFNIRYEITPNIPSGHTALADNINYDPFTRQFTCVIKISPTAIQNATDIYISQSIMHETIHAYLSFILRRIMTGSSFAQIQNLGYPKLFDTYVDSLINRNISILDTINRSAQYQHNFMANNLLEFFANALEEFDNDRINDDEYYWYMAWKGLQQSQPWVNVWPNFNTYPNANWDVVTNPSMSDNNKNGFKYALTSDRIIDIHNALLSEQTSSASARGKKPVGQGTTGCYQ
jgi:hypothetical protein